MLHLVYYYFVGHAVSLASENPPRASTRRRSGLEKSLFNGRREAKEQPLRLRTLVDLRLMLPDS